MNDLEEIIRKITIIYNSNEEKLSKISKINISELRTLKLFSKINQSLKMSEIAKKLMIKESRITKIIDGLEKKGLVARCPDSQDRRVCQVVLTEKGLNIKSTIDKYCSNYWNHLNKQIDDKDKLILLKIHNILQNK